MGVVLMPSSVLLSVGVLRGMVDGVSILDAPIVQVLGIKRIESHTTQQEERYRIVLSDAQFYVQAILSRELNHFVTENTLSTRCFVKLIQFICSEIQGRRIIVVLQLQVVEWKSSHVIGDPIPIPERRLPFSVDI